jgi:hydrogenase/urease accessory protein HupE
VSVQHFIRLLFAATVLLATQVFAHESRPVAIDITQQSATQYQVALRVPSSVALDNRPSLQWPADCVVRANNVQCEQPIANRTLSVNWPMFNPSVTLLMRLISPDGEVRAVLTPGNNDWRVPTTPTTTSVIKSYFVLGLQHILGGLDHLLFVAGLLLVARGTRNVILAITGFTLAHSITLSLAALGYLNIPIAPTEAAIALSILFLAREALAADKSTLVHRYPLFVSAAFGLLHGLGFAAALAEVGLPRSEITWALLFFNVGVEVGQLLFVLLLLSCASVITKLMRASAARSLVFLNWSRIAAYAIGIPAAYWLLARLPLAHAVATSVCKDYR